MRMGIGLGVGINRSNYAQGLFASYQSRVVADGGTTEAGGCVDAGATPLLQTASLLLIPSGYKANKLYSEIPTNGNGDFTWARTSTANRTNSSGNIELMATGVPRLSYMYGSCPSVLLEPQRTNGVRNSVAGGAVAGTPGTNPTNWTINTQAGLTKEIVGTGTENGLPYVDVRYSGTPTAGVFFLINFEGTNVIAATSGQTWAYSFYYKKISGTIPTNVIQSVEYNASGVFLAAGTITGNLDTITTLTRISGTRTLTNALTAFTGVQIRIDASVGTAYDFTMRFYAPQIELGAFSTTWIPTSGTSATRVADSYSRDNIFTNSLITSSGGTWFIEMLNNIAYTRDASSQGIGIGDSSTTIANGLLIVNTGSGRQVIQKIISGTATSLFTTTTDTIKIAIKWNGTSADVFVNGTKQVSATAFTTTIMEFLNGNGIGIPRWIKTMALFSTPLSDTDCTTLTT